MKAQKQIKQGSEDIEQTGEFVIIKEAEAVRWHLKHRELCETRR